MCVIRSKQNYVPKVLKNSAHFSLSSEEDDDTDAFYKPETNYYNISNVT